MLRRSTEIDNFQSRHSALARLLNLSSQRISIETLGHVGAPDLSFLFSVGGNRVGEAAEPTPFPKDGSGRSHALVPCAFVAYDRICRWNAKGSATRSEQIVFISELREHLDQSAAALADSAAQFSFELDSHLSEFRAHRTGAVSLTWKPQKNGAVFDLQLDQVDEDGTHRPLDLNQLDSERSPKPGIPITETGDGDRLSAVVRPLPDLR